MLDENNLSTNLYDNFESYEENLRSRRLNVVNDNSLDSKQKIIKSYEIEHDYLENQIKALVYSNDEMSKFDLNDEVIMESRYENLKFMQKYLISLRQIQSEIVKLDPAHPFLDDSAILKQLNEIEHYNKNIQNECDENNKDNLKDINQIKFDSEDIFYIDNYQDNDDIINEINL
jgi:hypothetical protein